MNKVYFGFPLVIVAAFAVFFFASYRPGILEVEEAHQAKLAEERRLHEIEERKRKEANIAALVEDSKRRKEERLAREEDRRQKKEMRDSLRVRYDTANGEIQSLLRDVDRLKKELEEEKQKLARAQAEQADHEKEKEAVLKYTALATKNAQRMQALIEQINTVEERRIREAQLAAQAAAAAKK